MSEIWKRTNQESNRCTLEEKRFGRRPCVGVRCGKMLHANQQHETICQKYGIEMCGRPRAAGMVDQLVGSSVQWCVRTSILSVGWQWRTPFATAVRATQRPTGHLRIGGEPTPMNRKYGFECLLTAVSDRMQTREHRLMCMCLSFFCKSSSCRSSCSNCGSEDTDCDALHDEFKGQWEGDGGWTLQQPILFFCPAMHS